MSTPDGWSVEAVCLDGWSVFRVRLYGSLYGGSNGRLRGICRTPEEVARLLGESFALLRDEAA